MSSRSLYISVEYLWRDFPSRLMIAAEAARAGFRVYLGASPLLGRLLSLKSQRSGIFLHKGPLLPEDKVRILPRVCVFAVLDEELSPRAKRPIHHLVSDRYRTMEWEDVDAFFVQSPSIRNGLDLLDPDRRPRNVIVSGWPRFDLVAKGAIPFYRQISKQIPWDARGVLFASSIGYISWRSGVRHLNRGSHAWHGIVAPYVHQRLADSGAIWKGVSSLADGLAPHQLVVRPHPKEDLLFWRVALNALSGNVQLASAGPLEPWILNASLLVHTSSTAGEIAERLGTPQIDWSLEEMRSKDPGSGLLERVLNAQKDASLIQHSEGIEDGIEDQSFWLESASRIAVALDDMDVMPDTPLERQLPVRAIANAWKVRQDFRDRRNISEFGVSSKASQQITWRLARKVLSGVEIQSHLDIRQLAHGLIRVSR